MIRICPLLAHAESDVSERKGKEEEAEASVWTAEGEGKEEGNSSTFKNRISSFNGFFTRT